MPMPILKVEGSRLGDGRPSRIPNVMPDLLARQANMSRNSIYCRLTPRRTCRGEQCRHHDKGAAADLPMTALLDNRGKLLKGAVEKTPFLARAIRGPA
jgi:hypothetical protein